jgi:hypothetical protein
MNYKLEKTSSRSSTQPIKVLDHNQGAIWVVNPWTQIQLQLLSTNELKKVRFKMPNEL